MRIRFLPLAVAICLANTGCRLTQNVMRTTIVEPLQYSRNAYEKLTHKQFIELAEQALDQSISIRRAELDNYACDPFGPDYQDGFVDGYVDYLEGGGTGEPPLLPPRQYWNASYQSYAGHQSAEQWFEGYRHGAECARASAYRSLVTIPLSDAIVSDTRPYTYGRIVAEDRAIDTDEPNNGLPATDRERVADRRTDRGEKPPARGQSAAEPPRRTFENSAPVRLKIDE